MKTLGYLLCCALLCCLPVFMDAYKPELDNDGNPITTSNGKPKDDGCCY